MTVRSPLARLAVGLALLCPAAAHAGWDNVFQATCCRQRTSNSQSYSVPVAPAPVVAAASPCCPQTVTNYVQRSYYQPYTAYQPVTEYVPQTSYRTSYYYEPVASVSYSMYVDPCTGCQQQVATPTTAYRLRSKCDAVTNYAARISYKPVTAQREVQYMEPVTTTYYPPPCGSAPPAAAYAPVPAAPAAPATPQPYLQESTIPQAPATQAPPLDNRAVPQDPVPPNPMGRTLRGDGRQPPVPAPAVRYDRMTSGGAGLTGQVVRADYLPRGGATLQLVSAAGVKQTATADRDGRFTVTLSPGAWSLYVEGQYHSKVDVRAYEQRPVTVVSR